MNCGLPSEIKYPSSLLRQLPLRRSGKNFSTARWSLQTFCSIASLFHYFRMHHWILSCGNASRIYSQTVILKHVSQHNGGIHGQHFFSCWTPIRCPDFSFYKYAINYRCIRFFVLIVNIVALDNMGRNIYDSLTKSSYMIFRGESGLMYYSLIILAGGLTTLRNDFTVRVLGELILY